MSKLTLGTSLILDTDFSESVTKTGETWIDGKPIYRKITKFTTGSGTPGSTLVSLGTPDRETIVDIQLWVRDQYDSFLHLNYYVDNTFYINYYVTSSGANIYHVGASLASRPGVMIIYYTKTTD